MLGVNRTRFLGQHISCKSQCRYNENMYYSKQRWNREKCRFKYKELDDWISCKKGYKTNF